MIKNRVLSFCKRPSPKISCGARHFNQIIPARSTFVTMIRRVIFACQMFTELTVIIGKFCPTGMASLAKLKQKLYERLTSIHFGF